ncbi:DMT family transporter [Neisseria musculi]|uniref:EamA-like transporter family protein n=1 Tax=Neisseria musculi TaxID=1815583 RepID=A0A7H1MEX0_9NEIS|nr:DMT family transporter [Neisseria musculi]QNT60185.1 eamA-like transporter family protein [Neisseria musculi]
MLYLIASIFCSVAVSVLLKLARSRKIDIAQAVAVNYIVAVVLCMQLLKPDLSAWKAYLPTWWLFAALGVLLPSVFVVMGKAVEQAGIVRADAAQRLSLFLPVLASFTLFGEQLSTGRLIGLALAFTALFCLLWKPDGGKKQGFAANAGWLLGVWAGYGVIDILFKQVAKSGTAFAGNLLVAFCLAGVLMFGWLFSRPAKWSAAGILGGMVLGCLNFANIFTYVRAHQVMGSNPTLVFAGMNIGVIVLGTLVGALAFKEKISAVNAAGIVVAVCAIGCLFYWNILAGWLGM